MLESRGLFFAKIAVDKMQCMAPFLAVSRWSAQRWLRTRDA